MKNKLIDLNNHLFAQLERIGDEDLEGEALDKEIKRSQAISGIASVVVSNASLALKAEKLRSDNEVQTVPKMIAGDSNA